MKSSSSSECSFTTSEAATVANNVPEGPEYKPTDGKTPAMASQADFPSPAEYLARHDRYLEGVVNDLVASGEREAEKAEKEILEVLQTSNQSVPLLVLLPEWCRGYLLARKLFPNSVLFSDQQWVPPNRQGRVATVGVQTLLADIRRLLEQYSRTESAKPACSK